MRGSAYERTMSTQPSVDPSSTMSNSKSRKVWASTLSKHSRRWGAALYMGMATVTLSIIVLGYLCLQR